MKKGSPIIYLGLGLGLLFCAIIICPTLFLRPERTDLGILLEAARKFLEGQAVYNAAEANPHTKAPLLLVLLVPLRIFPTFVLERAWDVMNIFLPFGLILGYQSLFPKKGNLMVLLVLSLLFTLHPWNTEIRLGQYNLMGLSFILFAVLSPLKSQQGICLLLALLIKPTNILFAPWVIRYSNDRKGLLMWFCIWLVIIGGIYISMAGIPYAIIQHQNWLSVMDETTQAHLARIDNFGIPSALSPWIVSGVFHRLLLLAGLGLATWISFKGPVSVESLALVAILSIVLSPLSWTQNYSLLLFYAYLLWWVFFTATDRAGKRFVGLSLLFLYAGTQIYNPTATSLGLWGPLTQTKVPLWGTLISVGFYAYYRLRVMELPLGPFGFRQRV